MDLHQKVVVVTGAAHGIGAALARRFAGEGAAVAVSDVDGPAAVELAAQLRSETGARTLGMRTDAGNEEEVKALVEAATEDLGPIDVFCSNAGIGGAAGLFADDSVWESVWRVNVMGHVYAARAVLPGMLRRRSGVFMPTISAAGLLTLPGDAPYTTTKHAGLGLAEWLACTYSPRGLQVSALCPMGVWTEMLRDGVERGHPSARAIAALGPIITAEEVADAALRGIAEGRFLILPQEEIAEHYARKTADRDAWITSMAAMGRRGRRAAAPAAVPDAALPDAAVPGAVVPPGPQGG